MIISTRTGIVHGIRNKVSEHSHMLRIWDYRKKGVFFPTTSLPCDYPESMNPASRYTIQKAELVAESEGPDYYSAGEFQVIERASGAVVASFPWSLEEAYLTNANYSGPDEVILSDDQSEAIARFAGNEIGRVLLPHAALAIDFQGDRVGPDTDMRALVREWALGRKFAGEQGSLRSGSYALWKLSERLGRSAAGQRLIAEVSALLEDPDPRLRDCALRFYYFAPRAPGVERLLELAEHRPELFTEVRTSYRAALEQIDFRNPNAQARRLAKSEGIE